MFELPVNEDFWKMYVAGRNSEFKNRIYKQWCAVLPYIQDKSMKNFDEFFNTITGKNIDNRPEDIIIAEIDDAIRSMRDGN